MRVDPPAIFERELAEERPLPRSWDSAARSVYLSCRMKRAAQQAGMRPHLFHGFDNPGEPSVTAIFGAGILSNSAVHAEARSVRARCELATRPPATAIRTTAFLGSHMLSRRTTSCTSPVERLSAISSRSARSSSRTSSGLILVGYDVFGEQPSQERFELLCRALAPADARRPTPRAAPAPRARLRPPVALHLSTARAARGIAHARLPPLGNFPAEILSLTRNIKRNRTLLLKHNPNVLPLPPALSLYLWDTLVRHRQQESCCCPGITPANHN